MHTGNVGRSLMYMLSRLGPIKEAAWVFFGQGLAFLGGLLGIKLLTNLMPPENYGELALGMSIAGVVNLFLFGPLGQVVLRFFAACRERGDIAGYSRVLLRLHRRATLFLTAACLPISFLLGVGWGWAWASLFAVALLFGIFSGVQGSFSSLLSALRDRRTGALTQGLDTWLRLGLAAMFVAFVGGRGHWAIVGYAFGSLMVIAIQIRVLRRHGFHKERSDKKEVRDDDLQAEFLAYGLPFMAFAGLASVSQYADRWLLQSSWGAEAVGIYAAMLQIASAPIAFLMGIATQLIIPVVFARSGNLDNQNRTRSSQDLLSRSVLMVGMLYAVVTLVAYLWGETLIALLTNASYARYASALWVIVLSQALFNLAQFMVAMGLNLNRPRAYFVPKFGQAATLLLAGSLLVSNGGIDGMALALLFSSTVYFLWVIAANIRLWKVHVGANRGQG